MLPQVVPIFVLFGAMVMPAQAQSPWNLKTSEDWIFPIEMNVPDAKQAFGAIGDGKADDTAALQRALDQGAFIYIPNGTYLVRHPLIWNGKVGIGPIIQGQSRDGVVIELAPDAVGFDDPTNPTPVLQLVPGKPDDKLSADYFKTRIGNLTIDATGHPGAIGLTYYANNNGTCSSVRIVGDGVAGLDLSRQLNGPLLVSNVEIEGFDKGVVAGTGPFNSQTLEHIVLKNQRRFGIFNDGECLMIRDLVSINSCPAVHSQLGMLVLIDSTLTGGDANTPAMVIAGNAFVRNVTTEGYAQALQHHEWDKSNRRLGNATKQGVAGSQVDEWLSKPAVAQVGQVAPKSMSLPVEVAPYTRLPADRSKWVMVDSFGAKGDRKTDDTQAVQKAFAHAATIDGSVVGFRANASYLVSGDLVIEGGIERIQGAGSYILNDPKKGPCRFLIKNGSVPVVMFDSLDRPLGQLSVLVENASDRTVVVNHLRGRLIGSGPGKSFLEDSCARIVVTHPDHKVWARQFNPEIMESAHNLLDGGTVWILGLKTEGPQRLFRCVNGGRLEVIGGWIYQYQMKTPVGPMFEIIDSSASFAGLLQFNSRGMLYDRLMHVSRNGKAQDVTRADNADSAAMTLMRTP